MDDILAFSMNYMVKRERIWAYAGKWRGAEYIESKRIIWYIVKFNES
jgi:hypothetical protein